MTMVDGSRNGSSSARSTAATRARRSGSPGSSPRPATVCITHSAYSSASPGGGTSPTAASSARASGRCSLCGPRSRQNHDRDAISRSAAPLSVCVRWRRAASRLPCSAVSRSSQGSCPAPRRTGSARSASARKYPACAVRSRCGSFSPASRSAAYARIVSSIRYRPSATSTSDFSTSEASTSSAYGTPHTASTASAVAPPENTASRRANSGSASSSSSQLHSTTARSVRCRGALVRSPRERRRKRSVAGAQTVPGVGPWVPSRVPRRSARSSMVRVRSRAAASSMARGRPSRAAQMSATRACSLGPATRACPSTPGR